MPIEPIPAGGRATVLVAEDDALVRELLAEVIGAMGYDVVSASDGPGALEASRAAPRVDLLVADVGLPGFDGLVLARRARAQRPGLKVLYVTGYGPDRVPPGDDPSTGFLLKPFAVPALRARVRGMVGA